MEKEGSSARAESSSSTSLKRPHMPDNDSEVQGGEASRCTGIDRDEEGAEDLAPEDHRAMAAEELYGWVFFLRSVRRHQVAEETTIVEKAEQRRFEEIPRRTPVPYTPQESGVFNISEREMFLINQMTMDIREFDVQDVPHLRPAMDAAMDMAARVHGTDAFNRRDPRMVFEAVDYVRDTVTEIARQRRYDRWRAERALRIAFQATETPRKVAKTQANTGTMPRQEHDDSSTSDSSEDE